MWGSAKIVAFITLWSFTLPFKVCRKGPPKVSIARFHQIKSSCGLQMSLSADVPASKLNSEINHNPKIFAPFGVGLLNDIKTKAPFYKSDFIDGINVKSLSSVIFLFFACLAPAVAFGGLLGLATNGAMGSMETIGATAIGGIIYAFFSGQPITIIGTTGPLLAFIKVLYDTCMHTGTPFLPVYTWIGLWSSLLLYLSSFFSASNLVEYFTKFTDDIFSSLISIIFIAEAVKDLAKNFRNPAISGVEACLSLIIASTTFNVATLLSSLRKSQFLPRKMRSMIADFAPSIGVVVGMLVARIAGDRYGIYMPTLQVPVLLGTTSGRPWLVNLFAISNKIKLLCILPALMASVLLFMDQNITVRLIMAKKNKLKKGNGIHLDMLAVAVVTTITSLLGMPWMVAATVRSLAHLRSLKKYETVDSSNKEDEPKLVEVGVQEQRVSNLLIHTFIGSSIILCRDLLRKIPVSVLTGIFMYLGFSSISTTELYERALLFLTDSRDAPKHNTWSQQVTLQRTKIFTAIQLTLLGSMWWLKNTKLGIFFPVLIGILAPIRIALEKFNIFSKKELDALDKEIV